MRAMQSIHVYPSFWLVELWIIHLGRNALSRWEASSRASFHHTSRDPLLFYQLLRSFAVSYILHTHTHTSKIYTWTNTFKYAKEPCNPQPSTMHDVCVLGVLKNEKCQIGVSTRDSCKRPYLLLCISLLYNMCEYRITASFSSQGSSSCILFEA